MKILHIWNQAGVSSILAKYQRKQGHDVEVIQQRKHDNLGISKYYNDKIMRGKYYFILRALVESRKYDLIHLHDSWFMVVPLRLFYNKKIVMHYHGSLIRDNTLGHWRLKNEKLTDLILVATPDLLQYQYDKDPYYLPDPIDTELFKPVTIPKNNRCFSVLKKGMTEKQLRSMLQQRGFDFDLDTLKHNKGMIKMIPYEYFNKKLKQYEYYADIPIIRNEIVKASSVCGLQALNMGLKVIDYNFKIRKALPDCHKPENVARQLQKYYEGLMNG